MRLMIKRGAIAVKAGITLLRVDMTTWTSQNSLTFKTGHRPLVHDP